MLTLTLIRHTATEHNTQHRYQGQIDPPLSAEGEAHARALAARLRPMLKSSRLPESRKDELPGAPSVEAVFRENDLAAAPAGTFHARGASDVAFRRDDLAPEHDEARTGQSPNACPPAAHHPVIYCSDLARAARSAALAAPGIAIIPDPRLRELDFGAFDGRTYDENLAEHGERFRAWIDDPERVRPPGGETLRELALRVGSWMDALPRSGNVVAFTHGGPIRVIVARVLGVRFAAVRNLQIPLGGALRVQLPAEPGYHRERRTEAQRGDARGVEGKRDRTSEQRR